MSKWAYTIASSQDVPPLAETAAQAVALIGNEEVNVYPLPDDVDLPKGRGPIYPTLNY